jgi:hypothetical protein
MEVLLIRFQDWCLLIQIKFKLLWLFKAKSLTIFHSEAFLEGCFDYNTLAYRDLVNRGACEVDSKSEIKYISFLCVCLIG